MLEFRDGTRKSDKQFSYSLKSASNQPTRWIVLCWSTFGAKTSHGQPRTHKTHHGPDLGEATTFPHTLHLFARATSKWLFVLRLPKGSPKTAMVGTPTTLRGYNFVFRPLIETKSEAKLYLSSRAFQWCVARHLHARNSGSFPTFCGRESNCQFDFRPFFLP